MKILSDVMKRSVKSVLNSKITQNNKLVAQAIDFYVNRKIIPKSNKVDVQTMVIEVTNKCNADCLMCNRQGLTHKLETLTNENFERILKICLNEKIKSIALAGYGEPLLDKQILHRMKRVLELGFNLKGITTNGSLLTEKITNDIFEINCLPEIAFSVDAYSENTYKLVDRGLDYHRVIENIQRFIRLKNKRKLSLPKIRIQMAVMKENEHEIEDFVKFWRHWIEPDGIIALLYSHNWGGKIDVGPNGNQRYWRIPCNRLWAEGCTVNLIGDVRLCCQDINADCGLGNIFKENSIKNVWNGDRIRAIRADHRRYQFQNIQICAMCNDNYFVKPYYQIIRGSDLKN